MFDENELESMLKLLNGERRVWCEAIEERHVVDGKLWFVRIESSSFVEPYVNLGIRCWCNNISVFSRGCLYRKIQI